MAPTDWDINDSVVPKVNAHDLNVFTDWPDGHCRRVYSAANEDVKKHTSGWAMRNTNNHNVNILKKSCLGVIVCSMNCEPAVGNKIQIRPAICDKARKKQRDKPCPNTACNGHLIIKPCRGHCGYPVTHFWRTSGSEVYFQAKGTHDHPRPEPKGSHQTKQLYTKRKTSSAGIDALKRKTAISTKLRSLRAPISSASISSTGGTIGQHRLNAKSAGISVQATTACAFDAPAPATAAYAWNGSTYATSTNQYPATYNNSQQQQQQQQSSHPHHHHQHQQQHHQHQAQQRVPWSEYEPNAAYPHSTTVTNAPFTNNSQMATTGDAVGEFLRPEDIFQLDQPIVRSPQPTQQNQFVYAPSTYSNGMSPSSSTSSSSSASSSASQSPPCTFLDLESGRIQPTSFHPHHNQQQQPSHHQQQQQHQHFHHQSHNHGYASGNNIKYEPIVNSVHSDDTASISNEFDETYMSFQNQVQNAEYGIFFGASSADFTSSFGGQQQPTLQHQQQAHQSHQQHHSGDHQQNFENAYMSSDFDMLTGAVDWSNTFNMPAELPIEEVFGRTMQQPQAMGF